MKQQVKIGGNAVTHWGKKSFEDAKGVIRSCKSKKADNIMVKKTKTLHRTIHPTNNQG